MTRILKLAPAAGMPQAGAWTLRGALRATLVRLAILAIRLATRLEDADRRGRERIAKRELQRPYGAAFDLRVTWVEAVVYLAMAALFAGGLLGVFVE